MGMMGGIGSTISQEGGADWEIGLSLIGRLQAQGDYDKAMAMWEKMAGDMDATQLPKFKAVSAQILGSSNPVLVNSEGRQAQSRALSRLQQLGDEGGMDAQARLAQQQALSTSDQNAKANRGAIMQGYARRGMQNSGAEMAAQLQNASDSANGARDSSLSAASEARNRALQSLMGSANVAGQMRSGDVNIQQGNQAAENARQEFNAKMVSATDRYNNDAELQNALAKLKRQQMVNEARGGLANKIYARGQQTAGDYASMGRAMNNKSQIAANGSEEMGF